jgi:hypothetical protein
MYREWPFFRTLLSNAQMALSKSDMTIAAEYAALCESPDAGREVYVLQARVWSVEAELAEKRADLANAQHGVAGAAIAAVEGRGGNPERVVAVLDATQSAEQVGRLKAEIRELEARRAEYAGELERYRASNAAEI